MTDVTAGRAKAKARAFLATLDTQANKVPTAKATSLLSGINTFDSSFLAEKNLTDFPPNLEAIRTCQEINNNNNNNTCYTNYV